MTLPSGGSATSTSRRCGCALARRPARASAGGCMRRRRFRSLLLQSLARRLYRLRRLALLRLRARLRLPNQHPSPYRPARSRSPRKMRPTGFPPTCLQQFLNHTPTRTAPHEADRSRDVRMGVARGQVLSRPRVGLRQDGRRRVPHQEMEPEPTVIRLYQGDCRDLLATLDAGSVDLILTDPPYGTTECRFDYRLDLGEMWAAFWARARPPGNGRHDEGRSRLMSRDLVLQQRGMVPLPRGYGHHNSPRGKNAKLQPREDPRGCRGVLRSPMRQRGG